MIEVFRLLSKIDEGIIRPDLRTKLVAGDHFAGLPQQSREDVKGLILELDADALLAQSPARASTSKSPSAGSQEAGSRVIFISAPEVASSLHPPAGWQIEISRPSK